MEVIGSKCAPMHEVIEQKLNDPFASIRNCPCVQNLIQLLDVVHNEKKCTSIRAGSKNKLKT